MKVFAVCEDHDNDQCSYPYLVDLDKLPENHTYRLAVESKLEDVIITKEFSYDYNTQDKDMLSALVQTPFTGTIVGLSKIYTE